MAGHSICDLYRFGKAFDSVEREIMWLTLQEYGIPRKIIQIIKILYDVLSAKFLMKESFQAL